MSSVSVRILLFLAFFLSGCSGLIYQLVWVRMLTRYVGATTYATATVLTVFMAGLALGSYLGGRFADRAKRPLRGYALLELAIAVTGLLSSFAVIRGLGTYYVYFSPVLVDNPAALLLARIAFIVLCLLPPTVLMGATLPLLAAYVSRLGEHLQVGLGRLYGINTFGAVAGVLAAGLVLIGEFGESVSLGVAAALNLVAALLVLGLRQPKDHTLATAAATEPVEVFQPYSAGARRLALLAFAISGFSALAYEILWGRFLVLVLLTSIYAFSIMLGIFLVGIALGSWFSSRRPGLRQAPLASFGMLEIFIGLWTAVGLMLLPLSHSTWLSVGYSLRLNESGMVGLGAIPCAIVVLPIAFAFGVQFPIAVRCCQAEADAPGRSTGRAYAVNTVGTILGAMSAGFVLIPLFGSSAAMTLVAGLNVLIGILLVLVAPAHERGRALVPGIGFAGITVCLALLVGDPYQRIMAARMQGEGSGWEIFRYYERATATTIAAGNRPEPRERTLLVNGYGMTFLCTETKLMTHLPYHLAKDPKRLLVICFGMGTTYRSACQYPDLRVDAVDIVPEVFECFSEFHPDAPRWLNKPNTQRHADDGRNYLLTHPDHQYDIITIDPAPPLYSAGTVNLYTKEFFQLCKDRLTDGGVLSLWIQPEAEAEILMIMRSFWEVFPEATLWGGLDFEGFYLIGGHRSLKQTPQQVRALAHKLSQIEELGEWKGQVDYTRAENLQRLYLTDGDGLAELVRGVRPVTDDRPYTEFPMWRRFFTPIDQQTFEAHVVRERLQHRTARQP